MVIPLSRSLLGSEEAQALSRVLDTGRLIQGAHVAQFEQRVAQRVGRQHALAVSSGTSALRLALEALGVGRGDDVLVPDLTWPSPGHAVLELGAMPVLVDVDPREWNVSASAMVAARTPGTRAAIVIDQFGCPARVDAIADALPDVPVIADAACSLGSQLGDRACGSLGVIACLSFHPRKVVTTGEGGMCLTDDPELAARLAELRNHGQAAPGQFVRASGNYRLAELPAALGIVQLGRLDAMLAQRRQLAAFYARALPEFETQQAPDGAQRNHQTYGVLLPEGVARDEVIAGLRARGVEAGRLSYALHALPQFAQAGAAARAAGRAMQHAEALVARGLALPLWPGLTPEQQHTVIDALRAVVP